MRDGFIAVFSDALIGFTCIDSLFIFFNQATPTLVSSLGQKVLHDKVLCGGSHLRILCLGGEACPGAETLRSWWPTDSPTSVINIYGITEVSSWASYHQVTQGEMDVPLGAALAGTRLEVRDEEGRMVTEGEGTLFVGESQREKGHCL